MKKNIMWLALAACLFVATPVMAKEGLYAGLFIPNASISGVSGSAGSGLGIRAGSGFSRYFSLEGVYAETGDLKTAAVDFKVNFPLTSLDSSNVMTVEPYLNLGYGMYTFGNSSTDSGSGTRVGFGVEVYLFRELSVQAGWTKANATFKGSSADYGVDVKTMDVGLIYHFL